MRTILVTGGAGFIGGTLVRQWLAADRRLRIVNLDRLTYAASRESLAEIDDSERHVFVAGDIADRHLVGDLLGRWQCEAIVHLAAETHVDRSIDAPLAFVETNVQGTARLLQASYEYWRDIATPASRPFRFVHVSTDEVYGSLAETGACDEAAPYRPNSPYAASKAASDHLVRAYCQTFGLPTLVTCSTNNYGPYQFPEKLIPRTIVNAVAGRPISVYGDGQQRRDWLHVYDHVTALDRVLQEGTVGRTYNIAGGCERTNLHVVETVCAAVDRHFAKLPNGPSSERIEHVADRPGHDFRYALDTSRLESELGWQPVYSFEAAINDVVRWYLDNADWLVAIDAQQAAAQRHGLLGGNTLGTACPAPERS